MAAESPVLGQLRHIPSSSTCLPSENAPPLNCDPLQGLVHEMALSAVIQKHGSTVPSTTHSSHTNGSVFKNYIVPAQSNTLLTPSSAEPQLCVAPSSSQSAVSSGGMVLGGAGAQPAQNAGVVLGGGGGSSVQQGFIALPSTQASGGVSLVAHPQASPVLQGTQLALPQLTGQLQEVGTTGAAAGVVQFTPVCCYEGTSSAQPSPVMERSPMVQPNLMG